MKEILKILILEDNPTDAEIVQRLLVKKKLNFEFSVANNKKTYRQALDQFHPDIILSDHSLPQFNSEGALVIARQRFPGIPFIMVTGTVSEEFAADIIKLGADDYILKDRLERLPRAIVTALQRKRFEKDNLEMTERLKRSEENYRTIVERVSGGFVALDKDWYYTYVNKEAGEIMHRKPEELIGKHIWTEFPEGKEQPFYYAYLKAMKEQQYIHIEEYRQPLRIWLENHIYPSPDGLSIFFQDITERKIAEEKIMQSEANLRAIFENTSEGFLLIDPNGVVITFNNKAGDYTLFSKEEEMQIGKSIYDCIEESRRSFFKGIVSKALKGESIQFDRSYDMANANTSWIDFSIRPVIEAGEVKSICITGRDITEKKIIEQEREFDRNNLKALINNTIDLLWSVDRNFNLITSNQAFDKMVKAVSGKTVVKGSGILARGFSEEQQNRFRKYYERAFSGESFTENEHADFPDDFVSEISFYPIYNGDALIGAACFSHDVTGRKKAEKEKKLLEQEILEQKVQEQKKIARAIIKAQERERNYIGQELHDNITQLLASSKLYLGTAVHNNEKLKEVIKYPIELLDSSINEIRLLSRRLVTPLKNIDLEELIWELIRKLERATTIKTDFTYSVLNSVSNEFLSDDLKLNIYRIIQEQTNNILKYAEAKNVNVSIKGKDNVINVAVADDGKGFDVEKKRNGIGISNIINRVESFNGQVTIESSPGNGCKLSFKISG